ncbi:hypothetical protein B0H11DRAFT_2062073 [Mycena galericulata]|nr:hypothetical protein B0H11DRAFT_2062073 [Mycena galericulata]
MLLLNVSNAWADIALSMPALWAVIRVVFPRAEGFPELLGIWLKRAHTLPLFLSLSNNFDEGVAPIVRLHAQRLKQLELRHDMDDGPISLFGGSSPGPLPLLDTLTFRRSNHLNDFAYSRAQILELLREAPNLVQCTFDSVKHIDRWANGIHNQLSHGPLVLPNLRSLLFTAPRRHSVPSNDSILTDLTTPRLEALSLSMHKVTGYGVLAFLKRSEPPLRELVLGDWFTSDDVTQLGECLRLVPTLVRFDVYWPFTGDEGAVFHTAFAESVLGSLPTLRSLTVRTNSDDTIIPNSFLETLLLALSSRHTQIAELKIISSTWSSDLKEETRIGFQRLVADGMEVNIGTECFQCM